MTDFERLRTGLHVLGEGGARLRTGRTVGRTLYIQRDDVPSRADILVGMMDTPALAELVVHAVNTLTEPEAQ